MAQGTTFEEKSYQSSHKELLFSGVLKITNMLKFHGGTWNAIETQKPLERNFNLNQQVISQIPYFQPRKYLLCSGWEMGITMWKRLGPWRWNYMRWKCTKLYRYNEYLGVSLEYVLIPKHDSFSLYTKLGPHQLQYPIFVSHITAFEWFQGPLEFRKYGMVDV